MLFENTETFKNLARAFAGECQAGMRYQMTAKLAMKEKLKTLSDAVRTIAKNETLHATQFFNKIIEKTGSKENIGETVYFFELFANNKEKLLSSEEYTSYIGAINGITTHKKNIEAGNFRVSLTKDGDFCVKLLNANGQLLCLCERYKTRSLCQAAIAAIKNFAQFSPVITDSPTAALIRKK